jgi:hypothetical protein
MMALFLIAQPIETALKKAKAIDAVAVSILSGNNPPSESDHFEPPIYCGRQTRMADAGLEGITS